MELYEKLSELTDTRREQGKRHDIELIVMLVIFATFSGYYKLIAIGDFVKRNEKKFIELFKPEKNRLPSVSTIRRVLIIIDFNELKEILEEWTSKQIEIKPGDLISIDGKEIKGTIPDEENKAINLISMFFSEKKITLSTSKVDEKSNEIPKVQEMLKKFSGNGVIITADALHCQKKTAELIANSNNYYILQVKANQKSLLKKLKFIAEQTEAILTDTTEEKNRGRYEIRKCTVHNIYLDLEFAGWKNIKYVIRVKRNVIYKDGKETEEIAYFITNHDAGARFFNRAIRCHWAIENSLHLVKDVTMREDYLRITTENAPQNLSCIKSFVLNILRINGFDFIAQAIRQLSSLIMDIVQLFNFK